jgi:hypothetical protein
MTDLGNVQFKLKPIDDSLWEETEIYCTIPAGGLYWMEIDEIAMLFSELFDSECRWNYEDSTQGHYQLHRKVYDRWYRLKVQEKNTHAK